MHSLVRQTATFVALLGILLSSQGGLVARVMFEVRQDHIAAHHCENRFDSESRCNGVCFLKKHVANHDKHDSEEQAQIVTSLVLYFLVVDSGADLAPGTSESAYPARAERFVPRAFPHPVYHPPRIA